MVQKSQTTTWDVKKPLKIVGFQLPSSTGFLAGFLNHQFWHFTSLTTQFLHLRSSPSPEVHPAVEALIIRYALDAQCAQQLRQLPLQLQVAREARDSFNFFSAHQWVENNQLTLWLENGPRIQDVFPIEHGGYSSNLSLINHWIKTCQPVPVLRPWRPSYQYMKPAIRRPLWWSLSGVMWGDLSESKVPRKVERNCSPWNQVEDAVFFLKFVFWLELSISKVG